MIDLDSGEVTVVLGECSGSTGGAQAERADSSRVVDADGVQRVGPVDGDRGPVAQPVLVVGGRELTGDEAGVVAADHLASCVGEVLTDPA